MTETSSHSTVSSIPWQHRLRYRLGTHDAVLLLTLAGIVCGLLTGLLINLFRFVIEVLSVQLISLSGYIEPTTGSPGYTALSTEMRFLLPVTSALILGIIYQRLNPDSRYTGLSHVIARLHKFRGHLPLRNGILQFFAGAFALACGHSGGREGPAIHIGAAANSFLARRLHLPHNSIRILIACGAAAAIGASFNTPIAGVIFAIEVIMMEYTMVSFVPVAVSAIAATSVTQILMGNASVFSVPVFHDYSLREIPFMIMLGLVCGLCALLFMRLQLLTQYLARLPVTIRFLIAGLLTGALALYIPQVLGIGYDHTNAALTNALPWQLLLGLCFAKIVASAVSNGVGLPIGVIGPSLVIGAAIGGATGAASEILFPEFSSGPGFYALLGMGGVMGALLNAPLAALIAILEMVRSPEALLPGIIVVVIASLCTDRIFGQLSVVEAVLRRQGLNLRSHPVAQALNRISMTAVTDTNIAYVEGQIQPGQLKSIFDNAPRYIVIALNPDSYHLLTRKNFEHYLEHLQQPGAVRPTLAKQLMEQLDSMEIPATPLVQCSVSATVTEARELLIQNESADGLYISDNIGPFKGVLRREALRRLIDSW